MIEAFVNRSTFISRMSAADALLYFTIAAWVTNILTLIMMFGLPAFPRPIPSSDTTPKPSSLSSLDSSGQADSETQDSSPPPQVNDKLSGDGSTTKPGSGMNLDEPDLGPGAKFSFATIMLIFIALSVFVKFACIQRWKQCYPVPLAWWDIFENVFWIVFVFELGVSSLALGRWLMLLCDLWGEAGRKALPIREYFLLMAVVIAIVFPCVLLLRCFQAVRKWYRSQPKVKKDEFVTPLEARGLLTTDDSQADLD
jgi:hypothetical protein